MKKNKYKVCLSAIIFAALTSNCYPSLLVYEGFDYGSVSDGSTMNGVTTNATGLTGNYGVSNINGATSTYSTTGLSFGSTFGPVTGGAMHQNSSTASSTTFAGVQWNAGSVTGDLWVSYLVNWSTLSTAGQPNSNVRFNSVITGSSPDNRRFQATADSTSVQTIGTGYGSAALPGTPSGAGTYLVDTTYLYVGQFTHVGEALSGGTPGVATTYMFTQTAYENWIANGGDLSASIGTYAFASASASVTSGTYTLDNTFFLQYVQSTGSVATTQNVIFDEVRYGTTINDVAAVPESSTTSIVLAGIALVFAMLSGLRKSYLKRK